MRRTAVILVSGLAASLALAGCSQDPPVPLVLGDCLIISGVGESGDSVPTVACDEAHEAEVYATFDVGGSDTYDEEAVVAEVEEECVSRFEAYTGEPYSSSPLDIFYTWPLAEGWDAGERGAVCAAFVPDESGVPQLFEGTLAAF
ncbi:septum formation family protein [Demequina sp. SYSU T00039]|uniref:Septum formation family protein n=1 Tax=Demequina lignilytica TaxID=3051663 RepID=A0AAW7M676_9MICO|nr:MULTISPECIES: septum formation family protein [unclassified Demequina]MDN4478755.1 septum formation family protein [Demequina sp. SYSU T00039-1]MDN4488732.1 septum formation family protein [Demequina sp. SYSU T00039]